MWTPRPAALTQRRTFPQPRQGLKPCVAPYFADRGVGDMRGPPMGAPKMPPRRRWQAVIAPHNIDTQHDTHHGEYDSPAPPPGCDLGGTPPRPPRMSPRPRVAKYGATHGCNPSRGSELPHLLSSSPMSTACACSSTRSGVFAATPQLRGARPSSLVPL